MFSEKHVYRKTCPKGTENKNFCTERRLVFDEMEEIPQSATGTMKDFGKPDGNIIHMFTDEGQEEGMIRGNTEVR